MTYIMLKQILQRYMPRGLGKTFLPKLNHPYAPPPKGQMVNHIGDGEEADFAP